MSDFFALTNYADGHKSIALAVRAIVSELCSLRSPRSLCEIKISQADYVWLLKWASCVQEQHLEKWLDLTTQSSKFDLGGVSYQEGIGVLLLLLASEVGRREGREGSLWSHIAKKFQSQILFLQNQPTARYKRAVESAVSRLGIRNIFGREGCQLYYLSVHLQFGFTKSGLKRVPLWLSSGHSYPESVQYLLSKTDPLHSESFRQLWLSLFDYRRGHITREKFKQLVAPSPWILEEWFEELAEQCRLKLSWGTVGDNPAKDDLQEPSDFKHSVALAWSPPNSPFFRCTLEDLTAVAGGASGKLLIRDSTGGSVTIDCAEDTPVSQIIGLGIQSPQVSIRIEDELDQLCHTDIIELWDPTEEPNVFKLPSGKRVSAYDEILLTSKAYVLLMDSDLEVRPHPAIWKTLPDAGVSLYLLEPGWDKETCVLINDMELWRPFTASGITPAEARKLHQNITIYPQRKRFARVGKEVAVCVSGVSPCEQITFIRAGALPLDWSKDAHEILIQPFVIDPAFIGRDLMFTLGLTEDGGSDRRVIRKKLDTIVEGAVQILPTGLSPLLANGNVTVDALRKFPIRIAWSKLGSRPAEYGIFEGSTFVRRVRSTSELIGRTAGYGGPLQIRRPYNSVGGPDTFFIAGAVVDGGLIESVQRVDDDHIRIEFNFPITNTSDWGVAFWKPVDFHINNQDCIVSTEQYAWTIKETFWESDFSAIAICYKGESYGAAWPSSVENLLQADIGPSATVKAALIRWFGFPILSKQYAATIREFAKKYPGDCLGSWLLDSGLPTGLTHSNEKSEQWVAAVRHIFLGWRPGNLTDVTSIAKALRKRESNLELANSLMELDPRVMAHVLFHWIKIYCKDNKGPNGAGCYPDNEARRILRGLLQLDPLAADAVVNARKEELLIEAKTVMQVHENFIRKNIEDVLKDFLGTASLSEIARSNLEVCLSVRPFRVYLAALLMDKIVQEFKEKS